MRFKSEFSFCFIEMTTQTPKKKNEGEWFSGFEREFEEIEVIISQMIQKMMDKKNVPKNQPLIMGFAMKFNENGEPSVQEFDNFWDDAGIEISEIEPLVQIQNLDQTILLTVELPGVQKQDIDLNCRQNTIIVSALNEKGNYYKKIRLPERIHPNQTKARFNNNILEIELVKKELLAAQNKIEIE